MSHFKLSHGINKNKIFLVNLRQVTNNRFDPISQLANQLVLFSSSYPYVSLKEKTHYLKSGFGVGRQDQLDEEQGILQIRPTNINNEGDLIFDKKIFVSSDDAGSLILKSNDVLFNNTNSQELVGKTAVLSNTKDDITCSNHITVIRTHADLNPYYLQAVLNLYQRSKYFYSICTNWNNQSGVGLELLKKLPIPLPPIEKQNEIAAHIQETRAQAAALQQKATQILEDAKAEVERMILGDT